ncbi:hypothetical protein ACFL33_03880 [Pseudomonadota bacterium]
MREGNRAQLTAATGTVLDVDGENSLEALQLHRRQWSMAALGRKQKQFAHPNQAPLPATKRNPNQQVSEAQLVRLAGINRNQNVQVSD